MTDAGKYDSLKVSVKEPGLIFGFFVSKGEISRQEADMIQTVAILGAGAVGGYFVWGLSEKLGKNLWVIAKGERKEGLEREGLTINGEIFHFPVKTPEEAAGADLLLVATKYGALEESLEDIAAVVGKNTIVLSLLNGVDSEEIIGERIGREHMLYSIMKIASERRGREILFNGETTPGLFYGEPGASVPTERCLEVAQVLEGTPLHYHISPDIERDIWYKFALNVSQNQPQAIIGIGFGGYADSEHMAFLRQKLRDEVTAIAAAKGIDISEVQAVEVKGSPTAKWGRYSTLQDLDAKRHTEVDMFAGAVMRLGEKYGIPTPYNTFAYHAIKALEEKNDGLFDYERRNG